MTSRSWIRQLFARPVPRPACKAPARCRPAVEALEDRTLLNGYQAATAADLIQDIGLANQAGGTNTITLSAGSKSAAASRAAGDPSSRSSAIGVAPQGRRTGKWPQPGCGKKSCPGVAPPWPHFRIVLQRGQAYSPAEPPNPPKDLRPPPVAFGVRAVAGPAGRPPGRRRRH